MHIRILQIHSLTGKGKEKRRLIVNPPEGVEPEGFIRASEKFVTSDEQVIDVESWDSCPDGIIFVPEAK